MAATTGIPQQGLDTVRDTATRRLAELDVPSMFAGEDWRRTDPAPFLGSWNTLATPALLTASSFGDIGAKGTVVNSGAALPQGVSLLPLESALASHPEAGQKIRNLASSDRHATVAWLTRTDGFALVISRNVSVAEPLLLGYADVPRETLSSPATLVILEEGATASVFVAFATGAGGGFLEPGTLLVCGRNSSLRLGVLQRLSADTILRSQCIAWLDADARIDGIDCELGSRIAKNYVDAVLEGPGSNASYTGLTYASGAQHIDTQTLQQHAAPSTTSFFSFKTAVTGTAHTVYSGLIEVDEAAQKTDGYVQNRNLILGDGARADSVPRLEIRANDVKCGHGTTASHIDENELFYLNSRGIAQAQASEMIVNGFFEDALPKSGSESSSNGFADVFRSVLARAAISPGE